MFSQFGQNHVENHGNA